MFKPNGPLNSPCGACSTVGVLAVAGGGDCRRRGRRSNRQSIAAVPEGWCVISHHLRSHPIGAVIARISPESMTSDV